MKTTMLVLAALIAFGLLPSSALAATCADYSTQAEAQRALLTHQPVTQRANHGLVGARRAGEDRQDE